MRSILRAVRSGMLLVGVGIVLVAACAGDEFSTTDGGEGGEAGDPSTGQGGDAGSGGANGSGGKSTSTGGKGATGGATGMTCTEPADCDDNVPCTIDRCGSNGMCAHDPRCPGAKCCGGTCAECCDATDCEEGVMCTDHLCFAGSCTTTPNDDNCEGDEICSPLDDCHVPPRCMEDMDCPDDDPCRTPHCVDGLCQLTNDCQDAGLRCCFEGCAECCNDPQCENTDPCMKTQCLDGTCTPGPLCAAGLECCTEAEGGATCGLCCSADDCDDQVECTLNVCSTTGCNNPIDPMGCLMGEVCDREDGCKPAAQCENHDDCQDEMSPCARCEDGSCRLDTCDQGERCCPNGDCEECCDATQCEDGLDCTTDVCEGGDCQFVPNNGACAPNFECVPELGGCIECQLDSECADTSDCTNDRCDQESHLCVHEPGCGAAGGGQRCCGNNVCAECCFDIDCVPPVDPTEPDQCIHYECSEMGTCETVIEGSCLGGLVCCLVGGCRDQGDPCPL